MLNVLMGCITFLLGILLIGSRIVPHINEEYDGVAFLVGGLLILMGAVYVTRAMKK
jgi:hypothetical protein